MLSSWYFKLPTWGSRLQGTNQEGEEEWVTEMEGVIRHKKVTGPLASWFKFNGSSNSRRLLKENGRIDFLSLHVRNTREIFQSSRTWEEIIQVSILQKVHFAFQLHRDKYFSLKTLSSILFYNIVQFSKFKTGIYEINSVHLPSEITFEKLRTDVMFERRYSILLDSD